MIVQAKRLDNGELVEGIGMDGNFFIKKTKLSRGYNGEPVLPAEHKAIICEIDPKTLNYSFDNGENWYSAVKTERAIDYCETMREGIRMDNFNGGYIKASQEAYDLLVEAGYKNTGKLWNWIGILNDEIIHFNSESAIKEQFIKQFYINNGALSWDKPKQSFTDELIDSFAVNSMEDLDRLPIVEGEEDGMDSDSNDFNSVLCNNKDMDTISIVDDDGKVYEFEKPEFECEIFKIVDSFALGVVYDKRANKPLVQSWDIETGNGTNYLINSCSNLTPIKPKIEVEKVVAYEFCGQGAIESREVIEIEQAYWDKLSKGKQNEKM